MCRKKAFTLIELLVVIAIIALLLAIITPALRRVKEKAQFIFCKTNLRSYGLVMKLYLNEQDDAYPASHWSMFNVPTSTVPRNCQWHDRRTSPENNPQYAGDLWPYMDSQDAHMCPTFKTFAKMYGASHPGHNAGIPIEPQYAYSQNNFLGGRHSYPTGPPIAVLKESEVINPAGVLVWVEETIWLVPPTNVNRWVLNDTCFMTRHPQDPVGLGDFIATYHNTTPEKKNDGMGNAVFVDGHVELCDPYDKVVLPWGEISGNFKLAWPLTGTYSQTIQY